MFFLSSLIIVGKSWAASGGALPLFLVAVAVIVIVVMFELALALALAFLAANTNLRQSLKQIRRSCSAPRFLEPLW